MLVRARDEALGCCSGPSTAAARLRPRGGSGRRGEGRGHQREAKGGGEAPERRVGASASKRWLGGGLERRAGGVQRWRRGAEELS